ncbi:MAG TPA: HK97 gp10 family phage protein [Acidimicrobiia bacterium]
MTPKQVEAELRRHLSAVQRAAEAALYQGGSIIMTEAKQRAPVNKDPRVTGGTLRNSGYVTLPRTDSEGTFVEVGFGGAAKAYAVRQHEELSYRHEVGEAKYLERAINATEKEVMAHVKRVAARAMQTGRSEHRGPQLYPKAPE